MVPCSEVRGKNPPVAKSRGYKVAADIWSLSALTAALYSGRSLFVNFLNQDILINATSCDSLPRLLLASIVTSPLLDMSYSANDASLLPFALKEGCYRHAQVFATLSNFISSSNLPGTFVPADPLQRFPGMLFV